jgi:acetylornithine/N-succinyldiaminopimelate aminotransferase
MNLNEKLTHSDKQQYLQTFKRAPIVLKNGENSFVWDVEGNRYIDALAGIAVNNVGHCHPKVVQAIKNQSEKLLHISNIFLSEPQHDLSKKLLEIAKMDRVFFTNSGAESVEGAFKVARKYAHKNGRGGTIISMDGSFHGRTLATIATAKPSMQNGFAPIPEGFIKVPFNDIEALEKQLQNKEVGVVILEPIQGEGGINVADKAYIKEVRELCTKHNVVLIFDEIQCGMGRTGHWFAKDYFDVQPDIMTLAKGLGGGVPIGAFLAKEEIASAMEFGDHGTTFGGNPLVCAASLATISVIEEEGFLKEVQKKGAWFNEAIKALNIPSLVEIRGLGLMIGLQFDFETKPFVQEMLSNGVLANATANTVLRLVPPLTIGYPELAEIAAVIAKCIESKPVVA